MIRNSHEAIERMKPDRSDTKIARNTFLTYYHDELVALRFHETEIAVYTPWGVRLDVRGFPVRTLDEGWFTSTTWRRIEEFTPATVRTDHGLKLIGPNENVYVHGTEVLDSGIVVNHPIEPAIEERLRGVARTYPGKLRRYADRSVAAWLDWQEPPECCTRGHDLHDYDLHLLTHVELNEVVVLRELDPYATGMRRTGSPPCRGREDFIHMIRIRARTACRRLLQPAVQKLAPGVLPYPQRA